MVAILNKIPKPLYILTLGGLLVAAVATLKPAPKPVPVPTPEPPRVTVILANPETQALTVRSQGTVAPRREIDLVAEVGGRITQVADQFVDGAFVQARQMLVSIDPRDYQLALIQAEARIADARQLLATERGRVRQAKREWRDLGNRDANELFLRKPQLAAAEAQLESARADRDKTKLSLERTTISAPFAGRIRQTLVDLGQYVTPGSKVASVYDTSVAEIRLPLSDRQAGLIDLPLGFYDNNHKDPKVSIAGIIGGKRYTWQGRITRTDASIDTRSRFYYAVAEVENPFVIDSTLAAPPLNSTGDESIDDKSTGDTQMPLIVGLFVEAQIEGRQLDNVISLPKQALFKRNHIYTLDADNRVREKTVTLLHSEGNRAWVTGDIETGEAIVIGQQSYLDEGIVVIPQPVKKLVTVDPGPLRRRNKSNQQAGFIQ